MLNPEELPDKRRNIACPECGGTWRWGGQKARRTTALCHACAAWLNGPAAAARADDACRFCGEISDDTDDHHECVEASWRRAKQEERRRSRRTQYGILLGGCATLAAISLFSLWNPRMPWQSERVSCDGEALASAMEAEKQGHTSLMKTWEERCQVDTMLLRDPTADGQDFSRECRIRKGELGLSIESGFAYCIRSK